MIKVGKVSSITLGEPQGANFDLDGAFRVSI